MYLSKVEIKNYRLFEGNTLSFEKDMTLIVGPNNAGKTSCINLIYKAVNEKSLSFNDYPISKRKELYALFKEFIKGEKKYDEIKREIAEISIEFSVDYKDDSQDTILGPLSPFIIDLDITKNEAYILVKYEFSISEPILKSMLQSVLTHEGTDRKTKRKAAKTSGEVNTEWLENLCMLSFDKMFAKKIYAVNPCDKTCMQERTQEELASLFLVHFISAERQLDEGGNAKASSLSKLVSKLFDSDLSTGNEDIAKFRTELLSMQNQVQEESQKKFNEVADDMRHFGYPNAEDLSMKLQPVISIEDILKTRTMLTYATSDNHALPSSYSGLGYKNLIKISFELTLFIKELELRNSTCIPLLVLEEPESHMHPQMQTVFVSHVKKVIDKQYKNKRSLVQTIITTHSPHIANAVNFSAIRYVRKTGLRSSIIELKNALSPNKECTMDEKFIVRYLTTSRCDLYFADKIILVEGFAERILLPDMIKNMDKCDKFRETLFSSKFISIIEVGGAHAHIFQPLLDHLRIPYLILTDIDFCDEKGEKIDIDELQKISDWGSLTTSNFTIKKWFKDTEAITLKDLLDKTAEDKTRGLAHIEYQVPEDGTIATWGRTFESALEFANIENKALKWKDTKKKAEHALNILMMEDKYNAPKYIRDGLLWLSENPKNNL